MKHTTRQLATRAEVRSTAQPPMRLTALSFPLSAPLSSLLAAGTLALACAGLAHGALPAPTPAQQQAAAAKKAQADAQAAKDKESLAASMDAVSARWRTRAAAQGWKTHAPVAIAAAAAPGAAGNPAGASAASASGASGTSGAASSAAGAGAAGIMTAAGQPGQQGQHGATAAGGGASPSIKSEKHGTAPQSEDVKAHPTRAVPQGVAPTVQKGSPDASKK